MNDRRFTELLNLYVDQQIAPAEASELEMEVQHSPQRRRVYNDYCRLQRACSLLGQHERELAPSSLAFARSIRDAERKISEPVRRPIWANVYVGSFAATAMAACVAVVFVTSRGTSDSNEFGLGGGQSLDGGAIENVPANGVILAGMPTNSVNSTTNTASASATSSASANLTTVVSNMPSPIVAQVAGLRAVSAEPIELQSVFAATNLGVVHNAREAEIAANDRVALEWMQRVDALQAGRTVVDEQAFEARPVMQQDNRVFRSRGNVQGNAEFTAFQFQR